MLFTLRYTLRRTLVCHHDYESIHGWLMLLDMYSYAARKKKKMYSYAIVQHVDLCFIFP
jgi:hypothetical protein